MTVAFVTGISGQDGTLLTEQLTRLGATVHGLVRADEDMDALRARLPGAVELHRGDLEDGDRVADLIAEIRPQEVYNLGGISSVGYSWTAPVETGAVTGLGAVAVFEGAWRAAQATGSEVRVLQASSAEIFGHADRSPQDESTPLRPTSPYGGAKAYAHHMAHVYRERGLPVSTVILYNHESPLRPPTFVTRKITMAAARIARHGGELVLGDVGARRDWGWAPDYVDAMVRVIRHSAADDFVLATGQTHTVEEFVAAAMVHAGVDDWRAHVRSDVALLRPAEVAEQVGDADKARRLLGWTPKVTFAQLVELMVDHDLAVLAEDEE